MNDVGGGAAVETLAAAHSEERLRRIRASEKTHGWLPKFHAPPPAQGESACAFDLRLVDAIGAWLKDVKDANTERVVLIQFLTWNVLTLPPIVR